jgi:dipeptide/tripeptide permease
MTDTSTKMTWKFPKSFWVANSIELFERAAYYGMFITLTLYLTREIGFTDVEAGWVAAFFAGFIYLAPIITGAIADKMGFKNSLALAFALLAAGYSLLGAFQLKGTAIFSLFLILVGGAFVKPIITGTVAKASDEVNRARAFSLFYQVVNIGAFFGKSVAKPLRTELGLKYINFYSAAMAVIAFVLVIFLYKNLDSEGMGKSVKESLAGLVKVLKNARFILLILIIAGFWTIQGQLYATMPKYALRMIGESAAPEWLANINPLVVVLLVVAITHLVRNIRPVSSIAIGLFIIPLSALSIALSPVLESVTGQSVSFGLFSLHPITLMLIIGISLQGVAECFLSPRFLEYASKQAPPGEVGLYMGYSHLHTFFAWLIGFAVSGYLLEAFCPNPTTLSPEIQQQRLDALAGLTPMPEAYAHAHYIWYVFAGIGVFAFCCLLVYRAVTDRIDKKGNN